jgi:hypothetical protein
MNKTVLQNLKSLYFLGALIYISLTISSGVVFGYQTGLHPVITGIFSLFVSFAISTIVYFALFGWNNKKDLYECGYCKKRIYGKEKCAKHEEKCEKKK